MKNKTEFTPGPWSYRLGCFKQDMPAETLFGFSIHPPEHLKKMRSLTSGGVYECKALVNQGWPNNVDTGEGYFYTPEEAIANAKLIAQAPKLFEALEKLMFEYADWCASLDVDPIENDAYRGAAYVIEKALKGESL